MRRRGLTLTEVIISLGIFLLVVILVFNLYPGSLLGLRKGEQRREANRLAQNLLDRTRARAFADLVPDSSEVYRQDLDVAYEALLEVRRVSGSPPERLKCVRVTVSWNESDSQRRQVMHEVWVSSVH